MIEQSLLSFWAVLQQQSLMGLSLSLLAYLASLWLYQRCHRFILLHPIVTASVAIALVLHNSDISYRAYVDGNQLLYFLLGPATVALAIPLQQEFHKIRGLLTAIVITLICGGLFAMGSAVGIAWLLDGSELTLLSLTPKSVTSPIAMGVAQNIGASVSLTVGVVVFTGVVGVFFAPLVFAVTGLADTRLQGLVLGLNAHGVGTAYAFERSADCGALATLAMVITGAGTALSLPYLLDLFARYVGA